MVFEFFREKTAEKKQPPFLENKQTKKAQLTVTIIIRASALEYEYLGFIQSRFRKKQFELSGI